jgi:hypothetical protein
MKRMIVIAVIGTQALTALAQGIATDDPTPGSREYYAKHIEGRYRYENGAMVPTTPVYRSQVAPGVPGVIRPTAAPNALTGTVVHVAGTNEVIVRTSRRMPSGAEKSEYAVLRLHAMNGISVEQVIATNVVQDGSYRCVLASGVTNILAGFRVHENPRTITYAEYLEVFTRDGQVAPIGEVIRIERISVGPRVATYADRLRERREAVRIHAASTNEPELTREALEKRLQEHNSELIRKGQPPLPIPLTREMDEQLVREGVLAPDVQSPTGKASQASQAIGAPGAPEPDR